MRVMRPSLLFFALLLITSSGCLFSPREAEQPGEEESSWVVPYSPRDVFVNLKSGLAEIGNSNYERSLAAEFTFVPLPEDEATLGSEVFADWTKEVEMEVLTRLKGDFQGEREIQFGDASGQFDRESIEVGYAEFEGPYSYVIDRGDGSQAETYSGKAIFVIEQSSQGWVLTRWEDVDVFGNNPTSGYLRGTLRGSG